MDPAARYQLEAHELAQFRDIPINPDTYVSLPERSDNRRPTDIKWLFVFAVAVFILFPFLIYTLVYADGRRLSHGTDNCGNICGYKNEKIKGVNCSGKDYSEKPYVLYIKTSLGVLNNHDDDDDIFETSENTTRVCISECPIRSNKNETTCFTSMLHLGETDVEVKHSFENLRTSWWRLIFCIIITILLSAGTLLLYRYATALIIWTILIFSVLTLIALTAITWVAYKNPTEDTSEDDKRGILVLAVFFTILSVIVLILLAVLFKKIKLVILLYKEATKAVFAMPGLLLIPVIGCLIQILIIALWLLTSIFMLTAGNLEKIGDNYYEYRSNGVMSFTFFYNSVIALWGTQVVAGCQYMIVAGSVAKWFFTRNKDNLGSPIEESCINTFKHHLGSVCLGSFIITLVAVIKLLVQSLTKNERIRIFIRCCIGYIESLLRFLSKNAYIEIAINAQPFFKSGKRAANLLLNNAASLIAVNSIGDFVLGMTQFLLICISTIISLLIFWVDENDWPLVVLILILNIVIVLITFGVFETTVDSLFVCFCEDKMINDGIAKPFYMTKGLMEFVESSKIVYEKKE